MAQLTSWQATRLVLSVGCGLILLLVGCASPDAHPPASQVSAVEATSFWKPYLLFIQSSSYSRLHIEVDAVEGAAPDDESLRRLHDFLAAHCDKPDGIQIVRDTVIPRPQARGIAPEALARNYMAGPPSQSSVPSAAYIYILLYDTSLSHDAGPNARNTTSAQTPRLPDNPHALLLPYPAVILADPSINGPRNAPKVAQLSGTWLQHEAGHLLGIARDPAHAADLHCREKSCLMYPVFSPTDLLIREVWAEAGDGSPMKQLRLCPRCESEAQGHVTEPAPSNLRFVGPVLVRLEPGYQVLALPNRTKLIVGKFDEHGAWDFAHAVQNEPLKPGANDEVICRSGIVKPDTRQDRAALRETLQRARQDPLESVRVVASKL